MHICISKLYHHWFRLRVCHLFSDNPLSEPMMVCCQLDPKEHISMKFHFKLKILIKKWISKSAKMAATLSLPQCLNTNCLCWKV